METTAVEEKVQKNFEDMKEIEKVSSSEEVKKESYFDTHTEDTPENIDKMDIKTVGQLLKQIKDLVGIVEQQWGNTKEEFGLNMDHIKQLAVYNKEHMKEKPDNLPEGEEFDYYNGLDHISEEKVLEIFGEDSKIIAPIHDITKDRLKSALEEFFMWNQTLREYREISKNYNDLLELKESEEIKKLEEIYEKETDDEKRKVMRESLDKYYGLKDLSFLPKMVKEEHMDRVQKLMKNGEKMEYLINRGRDKLKQLHISQNFILELSQFEKRFLGEKYHKNNNVLLVFFLNLIVYSSLSDKESRSHSVSFIMTLDRFIKNELDEEKREKVLKNILQFEDKFL